MREKTRDDLGLAITMLDSDRLREWAEKLDTHGSDISQWADRRFVSEQLRAVAGRIEATVREVGTLRELAGIQPTELAAAQAPAEGVSPQPIELDEAFIRGWGGGYTALEARTPEELVEQRQHDLDVFKRTFCLSPVSPVEPTCAICGKPATCRGSYDGAPEAFACDDCCGHGCEDGKCSPVDPTPEPPNLPSVVRELHDAAVALDGPQSVPSSLNFRRFKDALNAFKAWTPTGAPEPCVWRETATGMVIAGCRQGYGEQNYSDNELGQWARCPFCGHPLTVER